MTVRTPLRAAGIALAAILVAAAPGMAQGAERPLTLAEAIALALENNEGILVERESLVSAEAAILGARGAYDPLLDLQGGWRESSPPVNSAFSGAPGGRLAPTERVGEVSAGFGQ